MAMTTSTCTCVCMCAALASVGWFQGLTLLSVASEDEALRMLRAGQLAREVAEHQFNHVSSRRETTAGDWGGGIGDSFSQERRRY